MSDFWSGKKILVTGGKGFNIAISPNSMHKLELRVVGESTLFKFGEQMIVSNNGTVELDNNQETFVIPDKNDQDQICLQRIGFSSLEEFLKACKE